MTFSQFALYQDNLLDKVIGMSDTKGKEYANSENRFANFDRLSAQLGLTNIQIAYTYLAKHLDAISYYCKIEKEASSEPIERISL